MRVEQAAEEPCRLVGQLTTVLVELFEQDVNVTFIDAKIGSRLALVATIGSRLALVATIGTVTVQRANGQMLRGQNGRWLRGRSAGRGCAGHRPCRFLGTHRSSAVGTPAREVVVEREGAAAAQAREP